MPEPPPPLAAAPAAPTALRPALTAGRAGAVVAALVALAFGRSLLCGFVNFDDTAYVLHNRHLAPLGWPVVRWAFTDLSNAFWGPVTWLSLALDRAVWGLNPLGFHLTNVLLHAANAALVALLAARLLAARREGVAGQPSAVDALGGLAAGLFFGIHPLRVESVTWITERKDVLCVFFALLALWTYLRWLGSRAAGKGGAFPLAALGLTGLAVSTKEIAVTVPVLMLLLDVYPLRRLRTEGTWRLLREKLPLFAVCVAAAGLTLFAERTAMPSAGAGPRTRLWIAAKVVFDYLGMTAWPRSLAAMYLHPRDVPLLSPLHLLALAAVPAVTGLLWHARRREPGLLVAWLAWGVALLPVIGLVRVGGHEKADRFTYLPAVAVAVLAGGGFAWAWGRSRRWRVAASVGGVLWLAAMGALTVRQIGFWKDGVALWSRVIEVNPEVGMAWQHRGDAKAWSGDLAGAIEDYGVAIEIAERKAFPRRGQVYAGRAQLHARAGHPQQVIADATRAIELSRVPLPAMLRIRAMAYAQTGRHDEALEDTRALEALEPPPLPPLPASVLAPLRRP